MNNHKDIKLLLPAFVMHTCTDVEKFHVKEHLEACSVCIEMVAEFQKVATHLALGVAQVQVPDHLKTQVMTKIFDN